MTDSDEDIDDLLKEIEDWVNLGLQQINDRAPIDTVDTTIRLARAAIDRLPKDMRDDVYPKLPRKPHGLH